MKRLFAALAFAGVCGLAGCAGEGPTVRKYKSNWAGHSRRRPTFIRHRSHGRSLREATRRCAASANRREHVHALRALQDPHPRFRFAGTTQVIARRIRECQVYSEIVRFDISGDRSRAAQAERDRPFGRTGERLRSERSASRSEDIFASAFRPRHLLRNELMARQFGGQVEFSGRREYGAGALEVTNGSRIIRWLGSAD